MQYAEYEGVEAVRDDREWEQAPGGKRREDADENLKSSRRSSFIQGTTVNGIILGSVIPRWGASRGSMEKSRIRSVPPFLQMKPSSVTVCRRKP